MSFRRKIDHAQERDWRQWIEAHRENLHACGVPMQAFASREDFLFFADQAEALVGTELWTIWELERAQQLQLLDLLERSPSPVDQAPLLRWLRALTER